MANDRVKRAVLNKPYRTPGEAYNVGMGNVRRGTATEKADKYVRDVFTPKPFKDR